MTLLDLLHHDPVTGLVLVMLVGVAPASLALIRPHRESRGTPERAGTEPEATGNGDR